MLMRRGGLRNARRRAVTLRLYGVAFLVVLALFVGLAVASYQQAFTPVVRVTLLTDHVGNQLQPPADVKIRGLIVGEVRSVSSDGHGAKVELALHPDSVGLIPENVSARLLPKTLFGERYVSLVEPARPAAAHITAGDTIPQDRSSTAIELEKVFDDLLPLLRTVKPAQLSYTLNALATALDGRGDQVGDTLTQLDAYLRQLNPHMPQLQADITGLADLATTYGDAAPDLLRLLRDLPVTSRTLVEEQQQLAAFLSGTAGVAGTARAVLAENEDRIIRLGATSRPTLQLLARYAPEYPCLMAALTRWEPRIDKAFAGGRFHITLEVVPQRPGYQPGEEPAWGETQGPDCRGLPDPEVPDPGVTLRDGTSAARHGGSGGGSGGGGAALSGLPALPGGAGLPGGQPGAGSLPDLSGVLGAGPVGTAAERSVIAALVAPVLGRPADDVPDVAALLFGPLARGTVVGLA